MNPEVDAWLLKSSKWQKEFAALRTLVLECQLDETLKWGTPCYTLDNKNIVLIHGFKEYCALLFFKGALLEEHQDILIAQTGNAQAARQIRFTSVGQIVSMKERLQSCIQEAIQVEHAGLKVAFKKTEEFAIPAEFQTQSDQNPALKSAFGKLTPGRQRAYLLYFSAPKQSSTRVSRVAKCIPDILSGKGLNDD